MVHMQCTVQMSVCAYECAYFMATNTNPKIKSEGHVTIM